MAQVDGNAFTIGVRARVGGEMLGWSFVSGAAAALETRAYCRVKRSCVSVGGKVFAIPGG